MLWIYRIRCCHILVSRWRIWVLSTWTSESTQKSAWGPFPRSRIFHPGQHMTKSKFWTCFCSFPITALRPQLRPLKAIMANTMIVESAMTLIREKNDRTIIIDILLCGKELAHFDFQNRFCMILRSWRWPTNIRIESLVWITLICLRFMRSNPMNQLKNRTGGQRRCWKLRKL